MPQRTGNHLLLLVREGNHGIDIVSRQMLLCLDVIVVRDLVRGHEAGSKYLTGVDGPPVDISEDSATCCFRAQGAARAMAALPGKLVGRVGRGGAVRGRAD